MKVTIKYKKTLTIEPRSPLSTILLEPKLEGTAVIEVDDARIEGYIPYSDILYSNPGDVNDVEEKIKSFYERAANEFRSKVVDYAKHVKYLYELKKLYEAEIVETLEL